MSKRLKKRVVVGMSGGIDSSVVAWLLKEQGYEVIGLFMKNWEDEQGACSATRDYEDVMAVCEQIHIPCYAVNFTKEYWKEVFSYCLQAFAKGYTPNPDTLCNRKIKFHFFLEKALQMQADYLATGHYCRKEKQGKKYFLECGIDTNKDQSYFLYMLNQNILEKVLFPLGDMTKKQVRALAIKEQLITAHKKESMGICFIGKRDFKSFLSRYLPIDPGNFETLEGKVLGRHEGIAYYTIGQRKGLGIGGEGPAWFVVGKDVKRNVVFLAQGENHPALYHKGLVAKEMHWISNTPLFPYRCYAKVRYRSCSVLCTVQKEEKGKIWVCFDSPQKAITPGQAIVFYWENRCLGGAVIEAPLKGDSS